MRSAYSYLCYIPDFGRVRSIYPNAAAPHKPPFDMTEFGLIDTIRDMFAAIPRNGFDGIGDDCTVFPLGSGESLVFTADLLAENIHFLRRATSARELGRKSLAVNLSDVAAMGARPIATLLSLAIPHDLPEGWIEDFMEGYRDLSAQYDVGLVGGDTTASDSGLVVNVTAIGRLADSHIKRRSDARPGDLIAVGGSLGESGAGLRDILAGRYDTPLAQIHRNPAPQVAEGIWLGERPEVHAMMDISDGIASDLRHILHRSGVGAEVDTECIPTPVDLETAVSGGEDYKLLFTVAPESANTLLSNYRLRFGDEFHFIGRITGGNHLEWLRNGPSAGRLAGIPPLLTGVPKRLQQPGTYRPPKYPKVILHTAPHTFCFSAERSRCKSGPHRPPQYSRCKRSKSRRFTASSLQNEADFCRTTSARSAAKNKGAVSK